MALSESLSSYEDIRPLFERALTSPKGIRVLCSTPGQAVHLRQRLYKLRSLEKAATLDLYPPEHPARGTSPWDLIAINREENKLFFTHLSPLVVENL